MKTFKEYRMETEASNTIYKVKKGGKVVFTGKYNQVLTYRKQHGGEIVTEDAPANSVGGGNIEKNISPNLVEALKYGKSIGCKLIGVVGRDGGYTSKVADSCVIIPTVNESTITPHTEAFQAVVWHLIVSHPKLKLNETKWESVSKK